MSTGMDAGTQQVMSSDSHRHVGRCEARFQLKSDDVSGERQTFFTGHAPVVTPWSNEKAAR